MTAPHGPSEKVVEACIEASRREWEKELASGGQGSWARWMAERDVRAMYPMIAAEVRAAVVAECVKVAEARATMQRRLAYHTPTEDDESTTGQRIMHFVAGTEADAVASDIRALLAAPAGAVSAPGPTLPRTPSGWDGPTMREFVRGREWSCVQAETGDVITLDDRGLVTLYGFDGTPLSDLQALLAALASRAERGPGDAND